MDMESGTGGEDSGERAQRSNFGRLVGEEFVARCSGENSVLWDDHWLNLFTSSPLKLCHDLMHQAAGKATSSCYPSGGCRN